MYQDLIIESNPNFHVKACRIDRKYPKLTIALTPRRTEYKNQSAQILEETPTPISISQSDEESKEMKPKVTVNINIPTIPKMCDVFINRLKSSMKFDTQLQNDSDCSNSSAFNDDSPKKRRVITLKRNTNAFKACSIKEI